MNEFEELLANTPEVNDFRRLATGEWRAYSTFQNKAGQYICTIAPTITEALQVAHDGIEAAKKEIENED